MMSNKGKILLNCKECNRKRFCTKESRTGFWFEYKCSKGHIWKLKSITAAGVATMMEQVFTPEKMKSLFERDDTFYRTLKR